METTMQETHEAQAVAAWRQADAQRDLWDRLHKMEMDDLHHVSASVAPLVEALRTAVRCAYWSNVEGGGGRSAEDGVMVAQLLSYVESSVENLGAACAEVRARVDELTSESVVASA